MWQGVFPAVTTKFTETDELDHAEMERCFGLQMDAANDVEDEYGLCHLPHGCSVALVSLLQEVGTIFKDEYLFLGGDEVREQVGAGCVPTEGDVVAQVGREVSGGTRGGVLDRAVAARL